MGVGQLGIGVGQLRLSVGQVGLSVGQLGLGVAQLGLSVGQLGHFKNGFVGQVGRRTSGIPLVRYPTCPTEFFNFVGQVGCRTSDRRTSDMDPSALPS